MSATRRQPAADLDDRLAELGELLRAHHKAVEQHARMMVAEAVAAGEILIEVKSLLPGRAYGRFLASCGTPERSGRVYKQLAEGVRSGSAAVLEADSIREALKILGTPRKPKLRCPHMGAPGARLPGRVQDALWLEAMRAQGRSPEELKAACRRDALLAECDRLRKRVLKPPEELGLFGEREIAAYREKLLVQLREAEARLSEARADVQAASRGERPALLALPAGPALLALPAGPPPG